MCYHPLFIFNQFGHLERSVLRHGNVHSADGWKALLAPVIARYAKRDLMRFFRADAAFAIPELYKDLGDLIRQYARAREDQADAIFDECLHIADQYEQAAEQLAGTDHINRARLRIDTRKWMAGKLRPKKYGEKSHLEVSGDKENPLTVIERVIIDPQTQD